MDTSSNPVGLQKLIAGLCHQAWLRLGEGLNPGTSILTLSPLSYHIQLLSYKLV
jgi:hypothetical protein